MRDFVNLHVHSDYSLADGVSTVSELMSEAQRLGQPAIGLTDHGSVGGLMEFWKAGRQRGIKPILGVEAYVTPEKLAARIRDAYLGIIRGKRGMLEEVLLVCLMILMMSAVVGCLLT